MFKWLKTILKPNAVKSLSSAELMKLSELQWDPVTRDFDLFHRLIAELNNRGEEIRDWCLRLLVHREYDVRETGAYLLGNLGENGELGDAEDRVVEALGQLSLRPVEVDAKETQAVDAALRALGKIKNRKALPFFRSIFAIDAYVTNDVQWNAAEALSGIANEPFMDEAEPIEAAKRWLQSNSSHDTI